MPAHFDDIAVGQVVSLGVAAIDNRALETFARIFVPGWTEADGAPEPFLYALWSKLDAEASSLARDALRAPAVIAHIRGRWATVPARSGKRTPRRKFA